ncbi:hypothetical protein [uncultured Secundilactobacillus sp.]|uniref:hypothetical protein n=1 Tax=uncultured Secundilactobacillus sp. TaxID=2813935 RepID=UPI002585D2E0|nr:hypothetical protein [uncultured Secundilactobacillus sp.]
METKQVIALIIEDCKTFEKDILNPTFTQIKSEDKIALIFQRLGSLIDKTFVEGTDKLPSHPEIKGILEQNPTFFDAVKFVNNTVKHNLSLTVDNRSQPFILNSSVLNGSDVVEGDVGWSIDTNKTTSSKKQKDAYIQEFKNKDGAVITTLYRIQNILNQV